MSVRAEEKEKEWAVIQDKTAPLSPFMTRPITVLAVTIHPILYCSVQGIPVISVQTEFIVWRETVKYDRPNQ